MEIQEGVLAATPGEVPRPEREGRRLWDELLASCIWGFPWDSLDAAAVPCPEQTSREQDRLETGLRYLQPHPHPHSPLDKRSLGVKTVFSDCERLGAHRVVISFMTATPQAGLD